jgi:hypothetical protein
MSDERQSEWTVDTLKEHVERMLALAKSDTEKLVALAKDHQESIALARIAALNQRFVDAERAIAKAEAASEKRFEGVNEFRQQLGDQARTFMPRIEAEKSFSNIEQQIANLLKQNAQNLGKQSGSQQLWAYIVGVAGVLIALVSLFIRFTTK